MHYKSMSKTIVNNNWKCHFHKELAETNWWQWIIRSVWDGVFTKSYLFETKLLPKATCLRRRFYQKLPVWDGVFTKSYLFETGFLPKATYLWRCFYQNLPVWDGAFTKSYLFVTEFLPKATCLRYFQIYAIRKMSQANDQDQLKYIFRFYKLYRVTPL